MKTGRPTDYKVEYNEQVIKLCRLGATDGELADFFNVCEATINNWKRDFPEFLESIKKGKIEADMNVVNSLYKRATGYEHDEDKIFNNNGEPLIVPTIKHYPPEPTAIIYWLNNRRRQNWKARVENTNTNVNIEATKDTLDKILDSASGEEE